MTVMISTLTGAPLAHELNWKAPDWQKAESKVKRLQMRIAKAFLKPDQSNLGLSKVMGNHHASFLGELEPETVPA